MEKLVFLILLVMSGFGVANAGSEERREESRRKMPVNGQRRLPEMGGMRKKQPGKGPKNL